MRIRILLFAHLAEHVGAREIDIDVPGQADAIVAGDALDAFLATHDSLADWRGRLAIARNEQYIALDTPIAAGDVLALIPPVSGG